LLREWNQGGWQVREVVEPASLTSQVAETIREAIRGGELRPAELYSVNQLAEQLGVSRTPVREALLGLVDAGMVRFERNRGFRVVRRDPRHIAEVFHLRLLLEVPAVRVAARQADPVLLDKLRAELSAMRAAAADHDEPRFMRHDRAFHHAMLASAGNGMLAALVENLREITITVGASTVDQSRTLGDIAVEHEPILDAVARDDPDGAAAAMCAHLAHTGQLLLAQVCAENGAPVGQADAELIRAAAKP
jgi:DNA-binding GntR family transcriptional regulator